MAFFHYLINLEDERVPVTELPLDRTLAVSWLDFKTVGNTMAVQNLSGTRAGAMLSMAEWPSRTPSQMLDEFLKQPVEYIITQSFFFTDRITAEHDMRQERRRIAVNDHEGVAQEDKDEITQGLQDLTSRPIGQRPASPEHARACAGYDDTRRPCREQSANVCGPR